jgi:hypothetical protein
VEPEAGATRVNAESGGRDSGNKRDVVFFGVQPLSRWWGAIALGLGTALLAMAGALALGEAFAGIESTLIDEIVLVRAR